MKRFAVVVVIGVLGLAVLDVTLIVARVVYEAWDRRATIARMRLAPPDIPTIPMTTHAVRWRYVELFTLRPDLSVPGYRLDAFGLRMNGESRMDRHADLPCRKLWMFGGSTTFGAGLAEADTIPAHLQRAMPGWCVMNLGMGSQESFQNLLLLYEFLQRGLRPDAVLFYDGVNESARPRGEPAWLVGSDPAFTPWADPFARWISATKRLSGFGWLWTRFVRDRLSLPSPAAERMDAMIARYAVTVRLLHGIGAELGVPTVAVWQPALAYEHDRRPITDAERAMWQAVGNPEDEERQRAFRRARPERVHDLTGVFAEAREQVYMDPRHPNSAGTRLIATALLPLVRAAHSSSSRQRKMVGEPEAVATR